MLWRLGERGHWAIGDRRAPVLLRRTVDRRALWLLGPTADRRALWLLGPTADRRAPVVVGAPDDWGLAEGVEEGSDVVGEEGWLFQGCEVAAVVDVGPAG